jgi:hypothetical protein
MANIAEVLYEKSKKNGKLTIASTSPTVGWLGSEGGDSCAAGGQKKTAHMWGGGHI